jgi:hypothetical protein
MRTVCLIALALGLFEGGCASRMTNETPSTTNTPVPAIVRPSLDSARGPWDAERLKAAELLLRIPARSDLDRQRQALASAYIYWGDVLFKGFGLPDTTDTTTPQADSHPPQASAEDLTSSATSGTAAWASPPLWHWTDRQQQDLDRLLQQQREQYHRNRQPAPQFQRPPICNSSQVGGQVYTHCY